MQTIEDNIKTFREHGYKITPQRRLIFNILKDNKDHPRAEEIFSIAKTKMPDISKTTVYNTINELTELGLLETVHSIDEKSTRFDPNITPHHHLYCLRCHKINDIDLDTTGISPPIEETNGFEVTKKQITFYGYCPACQTEMKRNS